MFEAKVRCLSTFTTYLISVVAPFIRPSSNQYLKPCTFVMLERQTYRIKYVSCALLLTYKDCRVSCFLELHGRKPNCEVKYLEVSLSKILPVCFRYPVCGHFRITSLLDYCIPF